MINSTFHLIDMPFTLSRVVTIYNAEKTMSEWQVDDQWYSDTEEVYRHYIEFIALHGFLRSANDTLSKGIKEAIVTRADLTEEGFSFLVYSLDKWLGYTDRNRGKPRYNPQKKLDDLLKKWRESELVK